MADNLLFEHFATLATAPDGIARLRELILQLAVQGKLGTQDAGDEPASVLLKRIEKERRLNEEKIKKEKSLEPVKDIDVGFQIPDTWVLTRLGVIAQYNAETKTSANEISEDAWVFDLEDIEKDTSRILQKVRFKDRRSLSTKSRFRKGDILYGKLRPYLNKVVVADEEGYCTTEIVPIRPYAKIFPKFLMYALKTPDFLSYVNSKTYGIKMPRLGTVDALNTIIPLPPLAEQHRIVAKVDRLMALCDELETRQKQERAGCLKLGTATLMGLQNAIRPGEFERQWAQVCDAFDLILDCPENVAVLRQTILQMAVQGWLGTHDSKDEPAEKLVEKIRKEKERLVKEGKSKKEKPHEPVHSDEVPFILPNRWMWCRFGDVATIETNIVPPDDFQNLPHVAPDNLEKGTGRLLHYRTVAEDDVQSPNHHFYPNQIVYSKIRPNLSKLTIVDFEGLCSADMYPIYSHIFNKYLKIFMLSLPFYHQAVSDENRLAMPKINQTQLNLIYVAIPPLAEQHRIVAKVDALMALCDELEARLKERAGVQGRLAVAAVKQVTEGVQ